MVTINIEILSDIVCVWCYIGKRTLTRAITLFQKTYPDAKHDTFHITWRPYYLNPSDHNAPSVPKSTVAKPRLAGWSPEKLAAARNRVQQAGRAVGIEFDMSMSGRIGSTRMAHRVIHLAQTVRDGEIGVEVGGRGEVVDRLVEGIFEAYHVREEDITEAEVLVGCAVRAGIKEAVVRGWLDEEGDLGGEVVDHEAERNRSVTSAGVPYFIVQGEYVVDGVQDLQEFVEAFIKVREAKAPLTR